MVCSRRRVRAPALIRTARRSHVLVALQHLHIQHLSAHTASRLYSASPTLGFSFSFLPLVELLLQPSVTSLALSEHRDPPSTYVVALSNVANQLISVTFVCDADLYVLAYRPFFHACSNLSSFTCRARTGDDILPWIPSVLKILKADISCPMQAELERLWELSHSSSATKVFTTSEADVTGSLEGRALLEELARRRVVVEFDV